MCLAKKMKGDLEKINSISDGMIKNRDTLLVNEAHRLKRWYRQ